MSMQQVRLTPGLVISRTTVVQRGTYKLPNGADDGKASAIVVEGDGITVDFNGATLEGTPQSTLPDARKGTGVIVKGKNVTIKNLIVRGYRHGLVARDVPGLRILGSDFSYNWKQHLLSTLDREDGADWMSFHQNEKEEWLRFGEGIYLSGCDGFEVRECTATGGQSGLMIHRSNNGKIWNNNFSFLSALGLGMYRSSDNVVMHNKIDWCVRGYSHGVYNRGQDSAGILVYEQSNNNVFAYNSVTHGGDGFFLWAGQTTMDTGKGGCNDNLVYGNDFSHAPTNGIEATFSRNKFIANRVDECWHGVWGGYSYDTLIVGNSFVGNEEGIALEHGQNNTIAGNSFRDNKMGLNLWMNKTQDPNWGYPKNRDTVSHGYTIRDNVFTGGDLAISLRDTKNSLVRNNSMEDGGNPLRLTGDVAGLKFLENNVPATPQLPANPGIGENHLPMFGRPPYFVSGPVPTYPEAPKRLAGGREALLPKNARRGRKFILVNEWGPYDFKSPILWPRGKNADGSLRFEILGPKGTWNATTFRGATLSPSRGTVPGFVNVRMAPGKATDLLLDFEYRGAVVVSPFGVKTAAGKPYRFQYRKFFTPIDWTVKWFAYDPATQEPRTMLAAFHKILEGTSLRSEKTDTVNYAWGGSPGEGVPANHFATLAEGAFELPAGEYTLNVTSDDGVRVWIDGKLAIDNWTYHGPTLDTTSVKLGGAHKIRVEHFEIDGYSALKVELKPRG